MFKEFAKLELHTLPSHTEYFHPENFTDVVTTDSPALQVFTDFHIRPPVTIDKRELVSKALEKMKSSQVKALLVIDDSDDKVVGLIHSAQILGMKKVQAAQDHGINQTEVAVWMLMKPMDSLQVLNYRDLSNARVGHIARILHEKNLQHLLVYEVCRNGEDMLRGIFSATRISRQLGIEIGGDHASETIAEISKRI
ncbi:CBS domain-containing protein [Thiotrichales bacterium 19S3-7]|nr:CBS domain-containing protein [Thiotrichales bacterium 19S3-7]MCF6802092.1 CBS domain-containing protein [Thiotrichales bacterium 19S3-11]